MFDFLKKKEPETLTERKYRIIQRDLSATEQIDAVLPAITYLAQKAFKRAQRRERIFYGAIIALVVFVACDQLWGVLEYILNWR